MRILVILPNWLGDAVMATPAIEALAACHSTARFTFVGSFVSIEALRQHPRCERALVDETKKGGNRLRNTYRFAKEIGAHDAAISFRNQLHASLLLFWSGTPHCVARKSWHASLLLDAAVALDRSQHLVLQYHALAERLCRQKLPVGDLSLPIAKKEVARALLGINPGATYGSAKRWYPEKFAEVAAHFASRFDIVIFGGPGETEMAEAIETRLSALHVKNVSNLAGKTTIVSLAEALSSLSLFITNDSGPMHVAAAYQVPTVAIFGPTRHLETSQWHNPKSAIVRHDLECAPCMKRECPLRHHDCMKGIAAKEVIDAAEAILKEN